MASEYGFIYFLGNDFMPGIYKIGFTSNHPRTRLAQLSAATACPTEFDIVAMFGTEDAHGSEQEIHALLAQHRVNTSREFFAISKQQILQVCEQFGDESGDLFQIFDLRWQCDIEKKEFELQWKKDYFFEQNADPVGLPAKRLPPSDFSDMDCPF